MALITAIVGYVSVKKARIAEAKQRKELAEGADKEMGQECKEEGKGDELGQAGGQRQVTSLADGELPQED